MSDSLPDRLMKLADEIAPPLGGIRSPRTGEINRLADDFARRVMRELREAAQALKELPALREEQKRLQEWIVVAVSKGKMRIYPQEWHQQWLDEALAKLARTTPLAPREGD